jgi:hypothetical protein
MQRESFPDISRDFEPDDGLHISASVLVRTKTRGERTPVSGP